MKKSNIIFLLAVFLFIMGMSNLYAVKAPSKSLLSTFLKLFYHSSERKKEFSEDIHYVKISGKTKGYAVLYCLQGDKNVMYSNSIAPLNYKIQKDTLVLNCTNGSNVISLRMKDIRNLICENTSLIVNRFDWGNCLMDIKNRSNCNFLSYPYDSIVKVLTTQLHFQLSDESKLYLGLFQVSNVNVRLDNAMVYYDSNTQIEHLDVHLMGKSNVSGRTSERSAQIDTLSVSGNLTYFKPQYIGKEIHLEMKKIVN